MLSWTRYNMLSAGRPHQHMQLLGAHNLLGERFVPESVYPQMPHYAMAQVNTPQLCVPIHSQSSSEDDRSSYSSSPVDTRNQTLNHVCQVCGDAASGVHYGVQTCEGCKSFFKRSLQGKGQTFICAANNMCQVDKKLRRNCAACRLRVCHQVGMKSNGVRKRKQEKDEPSLPSKQPKIETMGHLTTVGSSAHYNPMSPMSPESNHSSGSVESRPIPLNLTREGYSKTTEIELPLSPVSLSSPPPSPKITDNVTRSPDIIASAEYTLTNHMLALEQKCNTKAFDMDAYKNADQSLGHHSAALCRLIECELPYVISWAKKLPDYRRLPVDDQILLTEAKCLELLAMSVIMRSALEGDFKTLLFSLEEGKEVVDILSQRSSKADIAEMPSHLKSMFEMMSHSIMMPLKEYAAKTIRCLLNAADNYREMGVSEAELALLKGIMFTNIDQSLRAGLNSSDLLLGMRERFRLELEELCLTKHGRIRGEKRLQELLLSIANVKDIGTRLEFCMIHQAELSNTKLYVSRMLTLTHEASQ